MRKTAFLIFALLIVFTSCEDTRNTLHQKYNELTQRTDSLKTAHGKIADMHETVTDEKDALQERLNDMQIADSSALAHLSRHEFLLEKQETLLGSMEELIQTHKNFEKQYEAEQTSDVELEAKMKELKTNYNEITSNLNDIHSELKRIEEDQKSIRDGIKTYGDVDN
tara:strand:+ start:4503 stop:5003 length:501 start_codon:yes stop_codon:yes gene_type:complete